MPNLTPRKLKAGEGRGGGVGLGFQKPKFKQTFSEWGGGIKVKKNFCGRGKVFSETTELIMVVKGQ